MKATVSFKTCFPALLMAACIGCASLGNRDVLAVAEAPSKVSVAAQSGPETEARAVWIASSYFNKEKRKAIPEIRTALDRFAAIGVNNLFCFHVMEYQHEKGWDFLEALLREAHARGIKVHPCWCPGHVYPSWNQEV